MDTMALMVLPMDILPIEAILAREPGVVGVGLGEGVVAAGVMPAPGVVDPVQVAEAVMDRVWRVLKRCQLNFPKSLRIRRLEFLLN